MDGVSLRRRVCVVCREPIVERGRIDRMYCSAGCRSLAWKERKRLAGVDGQPEPSPAAPPTDYADYAPHGTLIQLAQRLEGDRLAAQRNLAEAQRELAAMQRELAAAQQRIAELERDRREGASPGAQQQENNSPELLPRAAQAPHIELPCQPTDAPCVKEAVEAPAQISEATEPSGFTAQEGRTSAAPRTAVESKQAQGTATSLARPHIEHSVKSMREALQADSTQAEVFESLLSAGHRLLPAVALQVALEVQRMAAEGEIDPGVAAACALDWIRRRLLSKAPAPLAQQGQVLFVQHRNIFIQFAELVADRVMSTSPALRAPSPHRPWSDIAQSALSHSHEQNGQHRGRSVRLSGWVVTSQELLRDLCRAIVERIRYAASRKEDVPASVVASESLNDIAWRHFDESAAIARWLEENHSALETLTAELMASFRAEPATRSL